MKFRRTLIGALAIFLVTSCIGVTFILRMVWPPDIFSKEWVVAKKVILDDGTAVALLQRWGIDFYTSVLLVERQAGGKTERTAYFIDGDDTKIHPWSANIKVGSELVVVSLRGKPLFRYSQEHSNMERFVADRWVPDFPMRDSTGTTPGFPVLSPGRDDRK